MTKLSNLIECKYRKLIVCFIFNEWPLKNRVTQTGLTETIVQVGRNKNNAKHASKNATEEEKESLFSAEGSHELD